MHWSIYRVHERLISHGTRQIFIFLLMTTFIFFIQKFQLQESVSLFKVPSTFLFFLMKYYSLLLYYKSPFSTSAFISIAANHSWVGPSIGWVVFCYYIRTKNSFFRCMSRILVTVSTLLDLGQRWSACNNFCAKVIGGSWIDIWKIIFKNPPACNWWANFHDSHTQSRTMRQLVHSMFGACANTDPNNCL